MFKLPAACDIRTIHWYAASFWRYPSGHGLSRHGVESSPSAISFRPRKLRTDWATHSNCAFVLEPHP